MSIKKLRIIELGSGEKFKTLRSYKQFRRFFPKEIFEYDKINKIYREIVEDAFEEITVHFRVDYSGTKARKGHEFFIKDSYISMSVNKNKSDDDIFAECEELFSEVLGSEFNSKLANELEIVEGIERGTNNGDRIFINYGSSKSAGKTIKVSLTDARYSLKHRKEFLESLGKVR